MTSVPRPLASPPRATAVPCLFRVSRSSPPPPFPREGYIDTCDARRLVGRGREGCLLRVRVSEREAGGAASCRVRVARRAVGVEGAGASVATGVSAGGRENLGRSRRGKVCPPVSDAVSHLWFVENSRFDGAMGKEDAALARVYVR